MLLVSQEISRYRDSAVLTAVEALQEAAVVDQFTRCLRCVADNFKLNFLATSTSNYK